MPPGGQTVPENFAKSIEFSVHKGIGNSSRASLDRGRIRFVDEHEVPGPMPLGSVERSNTRSPRFGRERQSGL